jgi:hypothetical protein
MDTGLGRVDRLYRLKNWDAFQDVLEDAKRQKAEHALRIRQAKMDKVWAEPNPYTSYPAESIENLAEIVGLKNRVTTAHIWINKKIIQCTIRSSKKSNIEICC